MRKLFPFLSIILLIVCVCVLESKRPPSKKTDLNHIALHVSDIQKSVSFYLKVIGLDTMPNPFNDGKHIWFKLQDHSQLHLIEGGVKADRDKFEHLCFTIENMQNYIDMLNKYKIAYEDWAGKKNAVTLRPDGVHQIYFTDPDGHWIEINDDKF